MYAVNDNPNIPINVGQDLSIPCCTGNNFILNPVEKEILINLPDAPNSMMISDNNYIQINYSDSIVDIINRTKLEVELENNFELNYDSNTTSLITFSLNSDVFISTQSNYSTNFSISVIKKAYNFYSEFVDYFGNMFGDALEPFIKICAYHSDYDSDQYCSYKNKNLAAKIFRGPFIYREVEIVPLKSNNEIKLPYINKPVNVYIHDNSTAVLSIKTCSSVEISSEYMIINKYWNLMFTFIY